MNTPGLWDWEIVDSDQTLQMSDDCRQNIVCQSQTYIINFQIITQG